MSMTINYLLISVLLQTNFWQWVLIDICKQTLNKKKKKRQIIDIVNYYLENLLYILKLVASSLLMDNNLVVI